MKISNILIALALPCMLTMQGCGDGDHTVPKYNGETNKPETPVTPPEPDEVYDWEAARTSIPSYTDMVLIYGGGHQRTKYHWDEDRFNSYVKYYSESGSVDWMFDAYLFLEFADYGGGSPNVTYATGYKDPSTQKILDSANQAQWSNLVDYLFMPGHNLSALESTIAKAEAVLGPAPTKRQIVISIPEPIIRANTSQPGSSTTYWGKIDGRTLDFSKNADRVEAVKWFIDQVRAHFNQAKYQKIELAGFYWLAEHATQSQTILTPIAAYLHSFNYSFNWIPYFSADGYANWASYGFDYAFLQPNYFFNNDIPQSRLDQACTLGQKANMAMEMEFDDNALASLGRGYKLRDYMNAFRAYKVWDKQPIAYYQGNNTVHSLRMSTNEADRQLYHEFGRFVTTRPIRNK